RRRRHLLPLKRNSAEGDPASPGARSTTELAEQAPLAKRKLDVQETSHGDSGADAADEGTHDHDEQAGADDPGARHVELVEQLVVPHGVLDEIAAEVDGGERHARADEPLPQPLEHERNADEPIGRADELHYRHLAAAGEDR